MNNELKKIIMISGNARVGKDYISNELCNLLGIKKYAFADTIREILSRIFSIDVNELDKLKNEKKFIIHANGKKQTYRNIYQRFGTEGMQTVFGKDVWVNKLLEKVKNEDFFIISDLRFRHEYDKITEVYGKENVITVNITNKYTEEMNHKSEVDMKEFNFDYIFDNSDRSNQEVTKEKINSLVKYIQEKLKCNKKDKNETNIIR